jgi:TIGR03009 family protein
MNPVVWRKEKIMRPLGLTLIALFVAVANVTAQEAKAQLPKIDPRIPSSGAPAMDEKNQKWLDAYLDAWEKRMKRIDALETKIVLTEVEAGPPQVKNSFTGEASLLKPNLAKMFLKEGTRPEDARKWRHFVADGKFLWEYDYAKKIARVMQLPKDGVGDNTLLTFLFGMTAADIKKRYDLVIDVDNPDKHNEHYIHIMIFPKSREDMQEFKKAELVLWKSKDPKWADVWMMPARLWFQHPNGNQVTWEFKNMKTDPKLMASDFKAPGFPDKEWKSEWSVPPKPTVTRTSAPPK